MPTQAANRVPKGCPSPMVCSLYSALWLCSLTPRADQVTWLARVACVQGITIANEVSYVTAVIVWVTTRSQGKIMNKFHIKLPQFIPVLATPSCISACTFKLTETQVRSSMSKQQV
eukprot:660719-Amphidinium_carterae.1